MKKLLVVVVLASVGVMGWRWMRTAPEPAGANLVFNRFWVDHLPQGEKDTVKVFALWQPESFGVFADQNHWRLELERFRYEVDGDQVRAIFPWSGDRETFTIKASRCDEAEMDYCLDITGSKHGAKRYYSRHGWVRRDQRSVDEFIEAELR
jgi:hypothetical protein